MRTSLSCSWQTCLLSQKQDNHVKCQIGTSEYLLKSSYLAALSSVPVLEPQVPPWRKPTSKHTDRQVWQLSGGGSTQPLPSRSSASGAPRCPPRWDPTAPFSLAQRQRFEKQFKSEHISTEHRSSAENPQVQNAEVGSNASGNIMCISILANEQICLNVIRSSLVILKSFSSG